MRRNKAVDRFRTGVLVRKTRCSALVCLNPGYYPFFDSVKNISSEKGLAYFSLADGCSTTAFLITTSSTGTSL